MTVPAIHIRQAVLTALQEDLGSGDITTQSLFPTPIPARAEIRAQEPLTLAGIALAKQVFRELDPQVRFPRSREDGDTVRPDAVILTCIGDGRCLLQGERTALNFLQHLSGIATLTAKLCQLIKGYPAIILDTRKTTPGLRVLEKWAVRLGGAKNHRHTLSEGFLIKDNHLALLRSRLSIEQACRLARQRAPHGLRISIEAESLRQVREALQGGADIILLDNMTPAMVQEAVALVGGRALIEVSGGVTVENVRQFAEAGADFISIGMLTHSAPAVNISMSIEPLRTRRSFR
ncbi:MAG: carboxylating nicotinate-nucleotide diphosphorylase [Nitrospirae bacterium]|nr:MAG: carboxylating nicotinate-nucleotide diphosphorylase [Nitrospirota bacterium]